MAINFPTSLDNFTNPSSGNTLDSPSHSLQHSDINDAVEALEAKLGVGASPAGSATSGQVLTAQGGGTALWATPTSPGLVLISTSNFTTQSAANFSSVLTNTYTKYRVILRVTGSATATLNFRFRENTTDKATQYYGACHYVAYTNAEGVAYFANNGTNMGLMQSDFNGGFISFDLYRVSGGTVLGINGTAWSAQNGQGHYFGYYNINLTNGNGFSFIPASGTISGTMSLYGYSE